MKRKIYLVKDNENEENIGTLIEVSGKAFREIVSEMKHEKRYFILLTDDIDYDCSEIVIETSKEVYEQWKREYNRHQYLKKQSEQAPKPEYLDNRFGAGTLLEELKAEDCGPDEALCKKEERERLREPLMMLEPEEKQLINLLYFSEEGYTTRELAKLYGVGKSTIDRRKNHVLKKIRTFCGTK